MKKIILLTAGVVFSLNLKAQSGINNLSFESWGSTLMGLAPLGWFGQSLSQQNTGAQQGSKYVRITTTSVTNNSFNGFLIMGNIVGNTGIPGTPFNQIPISLNGFYKTSGMNTNDSAGVVSYFKKNGSFLNFDSFVATNNVNTWTSFSIPYFIFNPLTPDTACIMAFSNKAFMGGGQGTIGARLDLDNLSFSIGTGLDQLSVGTSFLVCPDGNSNTLTVISKYKQAAHLRMTDLNGKLHGEVQLLEESTTVDLSQKAPGIYIYSILDDNQTQLLKGKFIVNK